MAAVSDNIIGDWGDLYDGFNMRTVGIGLSNPNIYASDDYAKKKTQQLVMGGLSELVYSGFEHDMKPMVLSFRYEPQYNTVMGFNLNYIPQAYRQAILKVALESNIPNLRQNRPLQISYDVIRQAVPEAAGIVRRYKNTGIRVLGNIPLNQWPVAIKGSRQWQNMYRMGRG